MQTIEPARKRTDAIVGLVFLNLNHLTNINVSIRSVKKNIYAVSTLPGRDDDVTDMTPCPSSYFIRVMGM